MNDYRRFLTFVFLLMISGSAALAQELMKVTGLVVDQNAEPLIGVTIKVKDDPKGGVVTGLDGDFSIMVQKGKTLVFSYLGYQTKELAAITSKLKVNMKEDNKVLDEVVVVGYEEEFCNRCHLSGEERGYGKSYHHQCQGCSSG